MRFLLGGYSADRGGSAVGVGILLAGAADTSSAGGALSCPPEPLASAPSPSWLAWHPTLPVLYAALEGRGAVQAFRRSGESTAVPLGDPVTAGESVCHVAVAPDGAFLVATCWGDGRVVRMGLDGEGRPGAPVVLAPTGGVDERPTRAHQARFLPGGLFATTDLGRDLVRFWRRDAPAPFQEVALPRGTGPRHGIWHSSGHLFVVTETSDELYVLAPDRAGSWWVVAGTPLSPAALAGDAAAEVALSRDGRFVYVGLRGSNTIAVVEVRGSGAELRPVALVEAGVDGPRHHVVVRDTVLVAGQLSHDVVALTLDERTGVPGRAGRRVEAPSPTMLLPDRV